MDRQQLLDAYETLSHNQRMARMVELGRQARENAPDAAQIISELERGAFYERLLALQSCYGSGDGALVLRALSGSSQIVRGMAVRLVALVCSDQQVQQALATAVPTVQQRLLKHLRRRRRLTPIDLFLRTLAEQNSEQVSQLVPYGSSDLVRDLLPQMLRSAAANDWQRLARFHRMIAAAALQQAAEAATQLDARLVWQANAVLPLLTQRDPDAALDLVRVLRRHIPLAQLALQNLLVQRPREIADLVLASDNRVHLRFDQVAHRLPLDQLHTLLDRQAGGLSVSERWLRRLAPAQRVTLYAAFAQGWRTAEGVIDRSLIALLPHAQREAEGRRHLALPTLLTRPAQRLPYAAFLPWDEARTVLDPFIRNPDADLRVAGLAALLFGLRYGRDQLGTALKLIRARRNEQDPVRLAMLTALADLPPSMWRAEHLDDLAQIIREALDAADLSYATARAAETLIVALLPSHPAWAVVWLATLVQERGNINLSSLEQRLSDADTRRIAPALLPVFASWMTREREGYLLAAATSFGRRLRVFSGLLDLLERLARETRSSWTAQRALDLIREHDRPRAAGLIPELLQGDPSVITLPPVYSYLHLRRQDLLTPFLGQRAYKGRFSTGKTRFVLPLMDGFHRWTSAQQSIFAETLTRLTRDEERDSPTLLHAIYQLAALPSVDPQRLTELADVGNPKLVTRDTALRALGRLDAGQGVPVLLAAMADDRARVAIYVLRRALGELPPDRALALLRTLPLDKVTVAKEVVRLIGELQTEAAYETLLQFDQQDLHRDVRVALLRALWAHLERATTWPILEQAARSPDPAIAAGVVRIPADRLSPPAQHRLAALLALLLQHPEPRLRVQTLQRCAMLPIHDPEQLLLPHMLRALQSGIPDESTAAASAVFATYAGREAELVGQAMRQLLPNRRALQTALDTLQATLVWQRGHLLPTARAVLRALEADSLTVTLRVTLGCAALPGDELAAMCAQLAGNGELHAEALMAGVAAISTPRSRRDSTDLSTFEATMTPRSDAGLRRLALAALVAQAQPPRGWDTDRVARLQAFRSDPAPLVAAAAQFTRVPEDLPTGSE